MDGEDAAILLREGWARTKPGDDRGGAMHTYDAMGYVASGLVLGAFGMQDMVKLRVVAMCSNLAFLVYAFSLGLVPVLVLHAILLPLNGWRLAQVLGLNDRAALAATVRTYFAKKAERSRDASCPPEVA